jgi:membrane protease YdiL (CAAX protease family)
VVAEAMTVLLGCIFLSVVIGLVLTLLLAPPTYRAEIELVEGALPAEDLIRRVDRLGLAPTSEVIETEGSLVLVLSGLSSAHLPGEELVEALGASGYRAGEVTTKPELDIAKILRDVAKPYLSLQALIFLLAGGLLAHFRVGRAPAPACAGHLRAMILGVGAGLGAFLVSLVLGALLKLLGFPVQEQEWVLELLRDRNNLISLIPWIVIIVPVSEEVFFRGYVFKLVSLKAGLIPGFAVSSLMFAFVHFNLSGFFIYLGIGLILAQAYRATSNLIAPIAGHIVHNSIVLVLLLLVPPA